MKSFKLFFASFALIIAGFTTVNAQSAPKQTKCSPTKLIRQIQSKVTYPELAEENGFESSVKVSFTIKDDNTVEVISTSGTSSYFINHVEKVLDGVKVKPGCNVDGRIYTTKISFKA